MPVVRAMQSGWPPTMCIWVLLVAVSLLLGPQQVAGQLTVIWTPAPVQTNTWTWTAPSLTPTGDVSVKRGDQAVLQYQSTSTATQASTAILTGQVSVTASKTGGSCNTANSNSTRVAQVTMTVPGMPDITIYQGDRDCASGCTFTIPSTTVQSGVPVPTTVTVAALFMQAGGGGGAADPGCPSQSVPITWGPVSTSGDTANVQQSPTYPNWNQYVIGSWLNQVPTTTPSLVSGGPMPGIDTPAAINIPQGTTGTFTWSATWQITISSITFCLNTAQQVGNTVTLTPGTTSSTSGVVAQPALVSPSATINLIVKGCDQPVTVTINDLFLRTQATFAWTHTLQATGATSLQVPWGGSGTVPARASFQRSVTAAQFVLQANIQLVNPENGPVWIQALQIQCPWTSTIVLQCGVNTAFSGSVGSTGSGILIPASGTFNCPVNQQVPGTWGADMTQSCTVYTQTYWNIASQQNNLILNFAAPREWVRINDCVQWSMTCSVPTGLRDWQPTVAGGPQGSGVRICGNDQNAPIPDQDAAIAIGGGWRGDGTAPGDCQGSVTSTCTSSLQMQNTGAIATGTTGGGTSAQLQVSATPINCPAPPPSPTPPPPSPPNAGPGFSGATRMVPTMTVAITNTYIEGTFGWTIAASVSPASQSIVMGSTGTGTYQVTATRGNADDSQPVRYIIEGTITLQNTYNLAIPVANVNAVLGTARVAASCPTLNGNLAAGASAQCTFRVLYSLGPAPGQMGAEVVFPDTNVKALSDTTAPFSFDSADVSNAMAVCGFATGSFAANEGMGLSKMNDKGTGVLRVDGQPVRVCSSTNFNFDVAFSPNLPLSCTNQPVLGTFRVYPDTPDQNPVRQAVATTNISVTCAGSLLDNSGDGSTQAPVTNPSTGGGSTPTPAEPAAGPLTPLPSGSVTVTLGTVATQPVQNVVWTLKLEPNATGGQVTKAVDQSADVKFTVVYSKATESMTAYSGQLTIANGMGDAIQVDSAVIELTDSSKNTVAQVNANCSSIGEVSQSQTLSVPAQNSVTCNYVLKAKVGGTVQATITVANVADAIQSAVQSVQSLQSAGASEGCATLYTGLGATTLVPDGRLLSGGLTDRVQTTDICQTGLMEIVYTIPPTNAPCGTYPFLATAGIVPSADTTTAPITTSASVDVQLTGCTPAANPLTASLSLVRSFKTRIMQWSVKKTADASVDSRFTYVANQSNTVNVTLLFTRTLLPGQKVTVAGSGSVAAGSANPPAFGRSRILILPMCADDICNAQFVTPSCDPAVTDGNFQCKFQADRLPVASGIVLALFYSSAGQQWPHVARPVVYDPNSSSGRRTVGRCATLTDTQQLSGGPSDQSPATVTKVNEVNALPTSPVCASSFLSSYGLQFSGVQCGSTPYDFISQAKATPSDTASGVASASLSFTVTC